MFVSALAGGVAPGGSLSSSTSPINRNSASPNAPLVASFANRAPSAPVRGTSVLPSGTKDRAGCRFDNLNFLGGDLSAQEGGHGIETNSPDQVC